MLVPGLVFLAIGPGLKQGIDFTGGSSLSVRFASATEEVDVRTVLADNGHPDAKVQKDQDSDTTFFIQTRELQEEQKNEVVQALAILTPGAEVELLSFDLVSAAFAREIPGQRALGRAGRRGRDILLPVVGVPQRAQPDALRAPRRSSRSSTTPSSWSASSPCSASCSTSRSTRCSSSPSCSCTATAFNDTIVIFDRLRENAINFPMRSLKDNVNVSISESIGRSLNTSLTLMFTLLALLLFGGPTIREFLWVLLIGVVVGTYSSIGDRLVRARLLGCRRLRPAARTRTPRRPGRLIDPAPTAMEARRPAFGRPVGA